MYRILLIACLFFANTAIAEDDPDTVRYKLMTAARMMDAKCNVLPYAERRLIHDAWIGSMTRLPLVAASQAAGEDRETYYAKVGQATERIEAELEPLIAQLPCDRANMLVGQAKMDRYVEMIALHRLGQTVFDETATDRQKQVLLTVSQMMAQAAGPNANQMELAIEARASELDYAPEDAARFVQAQLNLITLTQMMVAQGYDLRWREEENGYGLWNATEGRFERYLVFDEAVFFHRYSYKPHEHGWGGQISTHPVIVLSGRELDHALRLIILSADPEDATLPSVARISYGLSWMSYTSVTSQRDAECPLGACFSFQGSDLIDMRQADERNIDGPIELTLHDGDEAVAKLGPEALRERVGLSIFDYYDVPVQQIFRTDDS